MKTSDFDFDLPDERIARYPAEPRDASRLLLYHRSERQISHHRFSDLPTLLQPCDLLVLNQTRVIPARLYGKDAAARQVELLLLEPTEATTWKVLVRPGRKVKGDYAITLSDGTVVPLERNGDQFFAHFPLRERGTFFSWLESVGEPPLPPYFKRQVEADDRDRYQTVFAQAPGSIAAPTAGLHFTPRTLADLENRKIDRAFLTLHVGYGTFAPIQSETLTDHQMHFEFYDIPPATWDTIAERRNRGRVIAVGTTSLRALESVPAFGLQAKTNLYITPGYSFQVVDGLVTNFHLPRSSLFVLVASLIGLTEVKRCYAEAIREGYRFYSYGDAMLIL